MALVVLLLLLTTVWADFLLALRTTSPLELVGVLTGIACVWLAARNLVWNFPVALVSCGIYVVIFSEARFYSDAGLQVAFITLNLYGWSKWRRQGAAPELPITRTGSKLALALAAGALLYALVAGYLFAAYTNAALPYYDSATTAVSLAAQVLQARRKLETWLLWLAVDVVYVGMYWHRHLALTAALYAVFLGLAAYGFWQWRRETRAASRPPRAEPTPTGGKLIGE